MEEVKHKLTELREEMKVLVDKVDGLAGTTKDDERFEQLNLLETWSQLKRQLTILENLYDEDYLDFTIKPQYKKNL